MKSETWKKPDLELNEIFMENTVFDQLENNQSRTQGIFAMLEKS